VATAQQTSTVCRASVATPMCTDISYITKSEEDKSYGPLNPQSQILRTNAHTNQTP
jgi:hypothetical protein